MLMGTEIFAPHDTVVPQKQILQEWTFSRVILFNKEWSMTFFQLASLDGVA